MLDCDNWNEDEQRFFEILIPIKEEEEVFEGGEIQFESVDQIVIQQLETIESNLVDTGELVKIYRSLETL